MELERQTKLFKELHIDDSHNTWNDLIDNWFSVEALLQQTGELPNGQYNDLEEMINFLRNKNLHFKLLNERGNEFGSMYLSAKRFIRRHYLLTNVLKGAE